MKKINGRNMHECFRCQEYYHKVKIFIITRPIDITKTKKIDVGFCNSCVKYLDKLDGKIEKIKEGVMNE